MTAAAQESANSLSLTAVAEEEDNESEALVRGAAALDAILDQQNGSVGKSGLTAEQVSDLAGLRDALRRRRLPGGSPPQRRMLSRGTGSKKILRRPPEQAPESASSVTQDRESDDDDSEASRRGSEEDEDSSSENSEKTDVFPAPQNDDVSSVVSRRHNGGSDGRATASEGGQSLPPTQHRSRMSKEIRSRMDMMLQMSSRGDQVHTFLAAEYAGLRSVHSEGRIHVLPSRPCLGTTSWESTRTWNTAPTHRNMSMPLGSTAELGADAKDVFKSAARRVMMASAFLRQASADVADPARYVPREWKSLSPASKRRVQRVLTWENVTRWDFDVLELADLGCDPLLFVGWAVLGSPYAQMSMASRVAALPPDRQMRRNSMPSVPGRGSTRSSLVMRQQSEDVMATDGKDDEEEDPEEEKLGEGYDFITQFNFSPKILCNFLRSMESEYDSKNPYHNATHAADIVQATHAILQMGGKRFAPCDLDVFALLISAVIHDVGHPGTTNAYQVNTRSDLALTYNDDAVLENMHLSRAFRKLMGSEREEELDVFIGLDDGQKSAVRAGIIGAVMGTDMKRHFGDVSDLAKKADDLGDMASDPNAWLGSVDDGAGVAMVLTSVLHLADISAQARPEPIFRVWAGRVYSEFFAQGDAEGAAGLPISPLCDRETTDVDGSQVGFVKFVILPAFQLLGRIVPRVAEEIVPQIESNLEFWESSRDGRNALKKA